jgi:hypothetical protein
METLTERRYTPLRDNNENLKNYLEKKIGLFYPVTLVGEAVGEGGKKKRKLSDDSQGDFLECRLREK